jgi:hypothetical protein
MAAFLIHNVQIRKYYSLNYWLIIKHQPNWLPFRFYPYYDSMLWNLDLSCEGKYLPK